jgi:crotonobetainyl-CoA:carnitine CoA-transferase CaiB-like acyl-CoA transferase
MVSGPYCGKLLADLGAEVIKIEEPGVGDEARTRSPFPDDIPHPEKSGLFLYLNSNKMGITLNLQTATGKAVFKELAKGADILIEDNAPAAAKELGMDYESLAVTNHGLIMASITPFGQTGPYKDYKAYHLNSYHGSSSATILADIIPGEIEMPVKGGGYLGDYDSGLCAAVAVLGALYYRLFTGAGQHIDVSKQETLISLERVEISRFTNEGDAQSTASVKHMAGGLQRCKDGYVVITIPMQHQWEALTRLIGKPEWINEEDYADDLARAEHAEELNARIGEWMTNHTREEIYHRAQALSCPVGPISNIEDLLNSEQLRARDFFVEVEHPEIGRFKFPATPYKLSRTPWRLEHRAPLLGEHNDEVYGHRLGYSREDLVRMRATGTI